MPAEENPSFDPVRALSVRFAAAIRAAFPGLDDPGEPQVAPSRQPQLGDFQCNAAMSLSKRLGIKPRDAALAIVAHADLGDLAEPLTDTAVAGPGFINVRLRPEALAELVGRMDAPGLGVRDTGRGRTAVVDLCGVNLAKQMHVGHLRATVIGNTLARALARTGWTVIRQNHLGDWGLPIAMVTGRLLDAARHGTVDLARLTLDDLERAYKAAQRECDADERGLAAVRRYGLGPKAEAEVGEQVAGANEATARAKSTLLRLQSHDPETLAVWQRLVDITMRECLAICRRLHTDVAGGDTAGESSYSEELAEVVADLERRGIAEPSQGALVVRLDSPGHGSIAEPCLVRKSDGGFLYATTDLAAIRRRVQRLGADRVVYCVDARQALHFRQVFAAAVRAGYATRPGAAEPSHLEHAAFGMVLGEDGRPFKTRSGENVKLADLIDESAQRALAAVRQRSPDLAPEEQARIAEAVGVAAIKYADLSNDRVKDYVFGFDRMLAFEGNTGPYLLYALVRVRSIFRKAAERGLLGAGDAAFRGVPLLPREPAEKSLALTLLRYPGVVAAVADTLEPHRLCQYLYDLAGAFSTLFDQCPVLQAEDHAVRASRLRLSDLTARVLSDGLATLGIPTLERM